MVRIDRFPGPLIQRHSSLNNSGDGGTRANEERSEMLEMSVGAQKQRKHLVT